MSPFVAGQFALRAWFYWEICGCGPECLLAFLYRQRAWSFIHRTVIASTASLIRTNIWGTVRLRNFNRNFWSYVKVYFRMPCVPTCTCLLVWPEIFITSLSCLWMEIYRQYFVNNIYLFMIMSIPMFMGLVPVLPTFVLHPHNRKIDYNTLWQDLEVIGNNGLSEAVTSEVCTSAMSFLLAVPMEGIIFKAHFLKTIQVIQNLKWKEHTWHGRIQNFRNFAVKRGPCTTVGFIIWSRIARL